MVKSDCLYFVHKFDLCLDNSKAEIVALMPEVCYELDKKGIEYKIFKDFYGLKDQENYSSEYYERFLSWVNSFDDYLNGYQDDAFLKRINFVRLYAYNLKNFLEDILICCKNIDSILDEIKPSEVCLIIEESAAKYKIEPWLWSDSQELCYLVLPLICKEKNIRYFVRFVNCDSGEKNVKKVLLKKHVKNIFLKGKKILKRMKNFLIYKIFAFKRKRLGVLLLHDEGWLGNTRNEMVRYGWSIYPEIVYDEKIIVSPDNGHIKKKWEKISLKCMKYFIPSRWINEEAGIDLSSIVDDRFDFFLKTACPFIEQEIHKYKKILKDNCIKYVICPYKIHLTDFAIMAVASVMDEIFSVQIQHGGVEIFNEMWLYSEQPANLYIPSSVDQVECFDALFNHKNKRDTKVIFSEVWLKRYKRENEKIKEKKRNKKVSKRIYYLPSVQGIRRFNVSYPINWYYCFQRNLIEHFSKLTTFDFVIKTSPSVPFLSDPIRKYIDDNKFSNIFYEEGDLVRNLRLADKVITDYPSSPTYEARFLGLPVLSMHHEKINIREAAKGRFGNTVVSYSDCATAFRHVDLFLAAADEDYIVSMEAEFNSINFSNLINQMYGVN